jgi:hypothetical protein
MTRDWRAKRQIFQPVWLLAVLSITLALTISPAATTLALTENFDGVPPPALPTGWTVDQGINSGAFPLWQTSNTGDPTPVADSLPNSAFSPDPNNILDNRLYCPSFTYTICSRLSFRQNFDLEQSSSTSAYDCGVLEININNSGWVDIIQAGGVFETGGYDHTAIETGFGNPLLPSRPNWSGNSGGFITTIVRLPVAGVGLPVQLRWRLGSDNSLARLGWRIDNVGILVANCSTGCPAWTIAAVGDFNPATTPDYVLFNVVSLRTAIWYMNRNVFAGGAYGPTITSGWGVAGVGDFNRDGKLDYVLFNPATRQTAIWYLSGVTFVSTAFGPTLPIGWELVAIGDFNRDGKPDYVLYTASTGQTAVWYMNNNAHTGGAYGPTLPSRWKLAGVADFNQDSKLDYLLFNPTTLQSGIWYLSGVTRISTAVSPTLPAGWEIVGTGDFNGDNRPDYVLYKTSTRQTALWYMNNNARISGAYGPTLPCN